MKSDNHDDITRNLRGTMGFNDAIKSAFLNRIDTVRARSVANVKRKTPELRASVLAFTAAKRSNTQSEIIVKVNPQQQDDLRIASLMAELGEWGDDLKGLSYEDALKRYAELKEALKWERKGIDLEKSKEEAKKQGKLAEWEDAQRNFDLFDPKYFEEA